MYMAGRSLQSAQKLGNGLDKEGSVINGWQGQELLSKASRLAPESGPVQLPTKWLSGLFLQGKRFQNMKLSAHHPHLHTPKQNYTTTQVMPSWHVDKASLHIDILLLFQNLSLEIGLQPTHKLVHSS